MKIFIFLAFLCATNAYAQHEFAPGYIVKRNGDIEEGLISLRGSEFNSKKCLFKYDMNADVEVFTPDDIEAYRIAEGKYYVSKTIEIDNLPTKLFLECLISAKVTVWYTQVNSNGRYYLEKDGNMIEADNNIKSFVKDGVTHQVRSNQYIGILKYLFSDCPPLVKKADNADFSRKSFINLSKEYHEYVSQDEPYVVYEKNSSKKRITIGVDYSYGVNRLHFAPANIGLSLSPSAHHQFGINSQINLDQTGAFNLQASLRYYVHSNKLLNSMDFTIGTYPSDVHYRYSMLEPGLQLKYKIKAAKILPFASVGLFTCYFVSDKGIIYNQRFDRTYYFSSAGTARADESRNGMAGGSGEIGFETGVIPGNISFSFFAESILTNPMKYTYRLGLRCGYFFQIN